MNIHITHALCSISSALEYISDERIISRIWAGDHTVWNSSPEEIANRLGWLHLPQSMAAQIPRITQFVDSIRAEGFTHVVLLGMGGSSLAPDMLSRVFGVKPGYLQLQVLDSTHPVAVRQVAQSHANKKTLFIVATKSGTTSETLSLFRYFYQSMTKQVDSESVGARFIAITDPGTPLIGMASKYGFRDVFLNDPNVGGRYSALSLFGLVPAALLGLDIAAFLQTAQDMADRCAPTVPISDNPAVQLGVLLGSCALEGRDKATLLLSKRLASLGDWIEQLIAESTGKIGKGIVPVLENIEATSQFHGDDRVFAAIGLGDDPLLDSVLDRLAKQDHPVARIEIGDVSEVAGQLFLWEFATAIACRILGVHPFNQPNVESAKQLARGMITQSRETGTQPKLASQPLATDSIARFLSSVCPGDYVSIHAYLPPTPNLTAALQKLRTAIQERIDAAATVGYGPRFLHSTGQLHKGDRGNGHFIQLVSANMPSVAIPDSARGADSSLTFGSLITAQAFGDRQALTDGGRPVLTLSVCEPASETIAAIAAFFDRRVTS